MISKVVTDYLRNLAERLREDDPVKMEADAEQLIDLAITLDEERDLTLTQVLASFATRESTESGKL